IVKARGTSGATPKEVSDIFLARGIARSKNLIYNALSLLVKQRKLEKKDGRYFSVYADSSEKPVAPRKWKISAEGRLMPAASYMWASVQTVRGCAKHCSFCSVWRTDGQKPRQRAS